MADKFISAWGFNLNATSIAKMDKGAYVEKYLKAYTNEKGSLYLAWFAKKPANKQKAILDRNWESCKAAIGETEKPVPANKVEQPDKKVGKQ